RICEYPAEPKALAENMVVNPMPIDADGCMQVPEAPGLGIDLDFTVLKAHLQNVDIVVNGKTLYTTPSFD
ncbi:MAG: mandelate racemase/muconate lactonizing enzyme family protein, partial [Planctomycetes bacterium]|nr:mandelate racemase/muconate lactonizing enzyme family protein [Planctomycetota bacterium]